MPENAASTARLEAFSDGVIAVIITIMVLELKVPHENGPAGLYVLVPILCIYLLSFSFVGIYWINHRHLVDRLDSADQPILYANLGFLFCLSLLPFFTSYVIEKDLSSFAVALYAVSMMTTGFSFLLLRLAIHRALRRSDDLKQEDTAQRGKHLTSLVLYLVSVPIAYLHPPLALCLIGLVTVVWIVPSFATRKDAAATHSSQK